MRAQALALTLKAKARRRAYTHDMVPELTTEEAKNGRSVSEAWALLLAGVITFFLIGEFHDRGISQKWITTIVGTLVPFGLVLYGNRRSLWRWTLWASLAICLVAHCALMGFTFVYVFRQVAEFSILLWSPIMVLEFFALLFAVRELEKKFAGNEY